MQLLTPLRNQNRIHDAGSARRTNVRSIQLFIFRSRWSTLIFGRLRNTKDLPLPWVRFGILLITPRARIVQPVDGLAGLTGREGLRGRIVGIGCRGQRRIPELSFVAMVIENEAEGEVEARDRMIVGSGRLVSRLNSAVELTR